MTAELITDVLKMTNIKEKPYLQIFIEEDILVPDVKPDLSKIVSVEGKVKITEKENYGGSLRLGGDLLLEVLYSTDKSYEDFPLIALESKIDFTNDTDYPALTSSSLDIKPSVEHIDFAVINERKFRVKAVVVFKIKEYESVEAELFQGLKNDDIQLLKKKVKYTDVAERKKESLEIKEELKLKDGMPEIAKVLRYDVNVVENQKQISKDKAVINASVYYNVMYLSDEMEAKPVFFQDKSEFTQFIQFDEVENIAGNKLDFNVNYVSINPKKDKDDNTTLFDVEMDLSAGLEIYSDKGEEVVIDAYHYSKDINIEADVADFTYLCGSGASEVSIREVVNIPSLYNDVDSILNISGKVFENSSESDQDKNIIEGFLDTQIICMSSGEEQKIFGFKEEIPFRNYVEIPGLSNEMDTENQYSIKNISAEKINSNQIQVDATIVIKTSAFKKESIELIKSVQLIDVAVDPENEPSIILYVTKKGDNLWKIAKKFKTTINDIKSINTLSDDSELKAGEKLLLLKGKSS